MTFVITEACIDVMDVDCIIAADHDRMCFVHPLDCIDCAACESACPVGAIFVDHEVPKESAEFTQLNARYFSEPEQVRARVAELGD